MLRTDTDALGAAAFVEKIAKELYQSVYVGLGGSLDDGIDWASRGGVFVGIFIKILILLAIIGAVYWLLVYIVKHSQKFLGLSDKQIKITRSVLRYMWCVAVILAVMTQIGVPSHIVSGFTHAASWAGFYYVLWSVSGSFIKRVLDYYGWNESIEQLLKNLVFVLILFLASGTILAQFGFNIVSLITGLGIVGVAVGFAAQSTLANFISGIAILIEQSFQVGDWVRIGTQEGRVVKIALRTTHILDRNNIVIILPNSTVASSEVLNLTSKTFIRFDVPVRVALNSDVDKVRGLILGILKQNDSLLTHPLPSVTLDRVGEYDIHFIVRFWVSPAAVARLPIIKENLIENIKKELDKNGIVTPFPHMQVVPHKEIQTNEPPKDEKVDDKPTPKKENESVYQNSGLGNAQSFPDGS